MGDCFAPTRKVWWSCDVDGPMRCGWKICLELWCAVDAKAFEALPEVPLLHYLLHLHLHLHLHQDHPSCRVPAAPRTRWS